jgi:hypothetical protein
MKMKNRGLLIFGVIMLLLVSLMSSCDAFSTVKDVVDDPVAEYHELIVAYQHAQRKAADGWNCVILGYNDMNYQMTLANNYMQAEVERTEAYREALAGYGTKIQEAGNELQRQSSVYTDASGNSIPAAELDLAELAESNALPSDMGLTLQVYASSFVEAPLPQLDSEPVLTAQRAVSERHNELSYCLSEWNDAVEAYNIERSKIPGAVVGAVVGAISEYLNVSTLPESLPYAQIPGASLVPPTPPSFGTD